MNILVVNAGSSSLKYQLIDSETEIVSAKGICERIGGEGASITHKQLIKDIKALSNEVNFSLSGGYTTFGSPAVLIENMSVAGK